MNVVRKPGIPFAETQVSWLFGRFGEKETGGQHRLEEEIPDAWLDKLAIVGRPEECVEAIHRLVEAGADTGVLVSLPNKSLGELYSLRS